jgi:hypothetical protein
LAKILDQIPGEEVPDVYEFVDLLGENSVDFFNKIKEAELNETLNALKSEVATLVTNHTFGIAIKGMELGMSIKSDGFLKIWEQLMQGFQLSN